MGGTTTDNGIGFDAGGYFRPSVTGFFLYVLTFFDSIKEVRQQGKESVRISTSAYTEEIRFKDNNPSEKLLNILLKCFQDGNTKVEVNNKPVECKELKSSVGFCVFDSVEKDIAKLEECIQFVNTLFFEETVKKELVSEIEQLKDLYEGKNGHEFWSRQDIVAFLNQYYKVLSYLICEESVLWADGVREKLLRPLLNLGIRTEENEGKVYADMTAPLVLSALHLIYNRLDDYLKITDAGDADGLNRMVRHDIFLAKIFQIFRFTLLAGDSEELCHAALPAYMEEGGDNQELKIPIRPLSTYNSYQGIRELRLGEKIVYEIERVVKEKRAAEKYKIVLVGDIAEKPFMELVDYVEKRLEHNKSTGAYSNDSALQKWNGKIEYIVYTAHEGKTVSDAGEWKNMSDRSGYQFKQPDKLFQSTDTLKTVMDEGDLIFFLDCCQLYRTEIEPVRNLLVLQQSYSLDSYRRFYAELTTDDMFLKCKYTELYHLLTVYAWNGQLGQLKKYAKEDIIGYIKKFVIDAGIRSKAAYLYISDINAFNHIRSVQENMVRIEKYNQKRIGIARFIDDNTEERLPIRSDTANRCLRFNLWQFVKHNVISRKEDIKKIFQPSEGIYDKVWLNEVFVYLDYNRWKEELKISWSIEGKGTASADKEGFRDEMVAVFVRDFFERPFKELPGNMYARYLRNSYISFLYGTAMSVEDLVFLHILKRTPELVGKIVIEEKRRNPTGISVEGCKYSHKKVFWQVIEELDHSTPSLMREYLVLEGVKQNQTYLDSIGEENDAVVSCLDDVMEACRGIGYEKTALYTNCTVKRDGGY